MFLVVLFFACVFKAQLQTEIPILKYEELQQRIESEKDKILIVNFWSTTCPPCVKEMPHFTKVNNTHKDDPNFKMLLVSLDVVQDLERVKKFIKNKNLTAEVVILDDIKRMNTWIPAIDKDWGGDIPATGFYKNGKKIQFYIGEMRREEIENVITNYNNEMVLE
ncbi:MAG: TlpA family protein disulfide reductase [Flavobacteriaceae bacterium]|nr:TlpA family protein disulfide reductase [Flavobacteriaceae bacterium]